MEDIKEYLNTKRILNINHSSLFTSVHPRILFHIKILHFKMEFNYDSQKKKYSKSLENKHSIFGKHQYFPFCDHTTLWIFLQQILYST